MYNKDYLPEKSHRFIAHTGRKGSKKKIMNLNDSFFFFDSICEAGCLFLPIP